MEENQVLTGIYRHFKGGIYEVTGIAKHSELLEELVIYKNTLTKQCWARPLSMWNETVVLDGKEVSRFSYIAADLDELDSKLRFGTIEKMLEASELDDGHPDNENLGFCKKSTGEIMYFSRSVVACLDGDIDEGKLFDTEKEELSQLKSL